MTMKRFWQTAALLLCLVPFGVNAQQKPAPKPKAEDKGFKKADKTAEEVLTKYLEASGGVEKYEKIKSTITTGTLEMMPQNLKGTFEVVTKSPGKMFQKQSIQGAFEVMQGFDGKTGWAKDPLNGLRDLEGPELTEMKRLAAFSATPHKWRELYEKVEMLGIAKLKEGEAYAIRLSPKNGSPVTQYFDVKSFLLVRFDVKLDSPMGNFETESYLSDYREVDGVKIPFLARTKVGEVLEMVMKTTEVKNNVEVDDARFAKPK
jgi:hypothetical protein